MDQIQFETIGDVPPEIAEFYQETQIEVGSTLEERQIKDEQSGGTYTFYVTVPVFETRVIKLPAYYENGGHISPETVAAWDYHDNFIAYLKLCDEIELYNSTPQFNEDGEQIEFDPLPLPPKPER